VIGETGFRARFFEGHPLFWPIARAASTFAGEDDWPAVETYARAFPGPLPPPVRFEPARPRPRRRRRAVDPASLYDARIAREGCVPTRPRSWHDFLNALVWATFPRSKRALHERQLRALGARMQPGSPTLPPTRSREHDALALIDEGGVVVLDDGRSKEIVVFGHALYEGLVLGRGAMTACAIPAPVDAVPRDATERVRLADQVLARHLEQAVLEPGGLERVTIAGVAGTESVGGGS
jgi:hypothetical protein